MVYYAGLDLSMETTAVCVIDETGRKVFTATVESSAGSIAGALAKVGSIDRVVLETGRMSGAICYSERLAEAGIEPSVGSVGDSYDNALAESVIDLNKTEVIEHRGPWRNMQVVEFATLEWVDWFNNRRLLVPIGYIPPVEKEAHYYAQIEEHAMAA